MARKYNYSLYVALLISLFGGCIYYESLSYGFILDDYLQVVNNPIVRDLSKWLLAFTNSTVATQAGIDGVYYKPLMTIAYSLIWKLGSGQAFYFHLFQLCLHLVNCYLIYILSRALKPNWPVNISIFFSLLFLVHPINTETVVFIADLQEPLYLFFGLCGLIIIIRESTFFSLILAGFLFLLSLLSKETGLLFSLASLVYLFIYDRKRIRLSAAVLVVVISIYLYLRLAVAGLNVVHSDNMRINRIDFAERLLNVPAVLVHYIQLYFYPAKLSLTQDWVIGSPNIFNFLLPLLLVLFIVGCLIYFSSKNKLFLFFSIWFLMGWGLHSQIIPLDGTVSDRWFYFSFIGLTGLLLEILRNLSSKKIISVILFTTLPLFAYRSHTRASNWKTALSLYENDVKFDPESSYLNNNYGLELFNVGQYEKAVPYFQKTIELAVNKSAQWYTGWLNLGSSYIYLEQYDKAEHCIKIAIEYGSAQSFKSYLLLLDKQGKIQEFKIFLIETALKKYPNDLSLQKIKLNL